MLRYLGKSSCALQANSSAVDDRAAMEWFRWFVKCRGWCVLVSWNSTSIDDISSSVWQRTIPTEFHTLKKKTIRKKKTLIELKIVKSQVQRFPVVTFAQSF